MTETKTYNPGDHIRHGDAIVALIHLYQVSPFNRDHHWRRKELQLRNILNQQQTEHTGPEPLRLEGI